MVQEFDIVKAENLPVASSVSENDSLLIWQGKRVKRVPPSLMKGPKGDSVKGDPGDSAYIEWKKQPGNEGKSYAEYQAWLRQPATDAAADVNQKFAIISQNVSDAISATNTAKEATITATNNAQSVSDHPGYIGADYHVYVWDYATKAYKKTDTILRPEAFNIYRVYTSIDEMDLDSENVPEGKFVIINTGSVEEEDTGKLYVKTSTGFEYLVDISGMRGFTGKTPQFSIGNVTNGDVSNVTISEDGVDGAGNPKYKLNFILQRGLQGFTPEIVIGTVTTGMPGTNADVKLIDDGITAEGAPKKKLDFIIPAGATGSVEGLYQIQTIDHIPGENDMTYEIAGKTYPFQVGNELRYYDPEQADYVFYKLFDIKENKAIWKLVGSGGSDDTIVYLSAPEDFETSYIEIKDGGLGGL